jgi:hypothetical protein
VQFAQAKRRVIDCFAIVIMSQYAISAQIGSSSRQDLPATAGEPLQLEANMNSERVNVVWS